jgi:hypothetical protein
LIETANPAFDGKFISKDGAVTIGLIEPSPRQFGSNGWTIPL